MSKYTCVITREINRAPNTEEVVSRTYCSSRHDAEIELIEAFKDLMSDFTVANDYYMHCSCGSFIATNGERTYRGYVLQGEDNE